MDSQMQTPSVPSAPSHATRRVIITIIIVAALLAAGWVLYQQYSATHQQGVLTPEEQHDAIVNRLTAESEASSPIPDATKSAMLKELERMNNEAAKSPKTTTKPAVTPADTSTETNSNAVVEHEGPTSGGLTDEQRALIIKGFSQQ